MRPAITGSTALLALLLTVPAAAGTAEAAPAPAPAHLVAAADGPAAAALLRSWTSTSPVTLTLTAAATAALTVADRPTSSPLATTIRVARSAVSIVTAVPDPASGRLLTGLTVDRLLLTDLYSGNPVAARTRLAELNPGRALPAKLTGCTTAADPEDTQAVANYASLSRLASSCRYPDTANLLEAFAPGRRTGASADVSTGFVGYALTVLAAPAGVPAAAVAGPAGPTLPDRPGYPISTPLTATLTPQDPAGTTALATLLTWAAGPGQLALAPGLLPLTSPERTALQTVATSLRASSPAPTASSSSPAVIPGSALTDGPAAGRSPASTPGLPPAAQASALPPAPAPQPPAPAAQPPLTADLAALGRPPIGLTGSGLAGAAPLAVRLTGQPVLPFAGNAWLDQVPAPLLAPTLPSAAQPLRYTARAATVSRPSYDLLPGLLAGLLAGVGFLFSLHYVRPSRVGLLSPTRPRGRTIRSEPVRFAHRAAGRFMAASLSVRRVPLRRSSRPLTTNPPVGDAVREPDMVDVREEAESPMTDGQISPMTWSSWQ